MPECFLEFPIVGHGPAYLRHLLASQAGLEDLAAGKADRKHPHGVAAAGGALAATAGMADRAMEQRASQDCGKIGEALEDSLGLLL